LKSRLTPEQDGDWIDWTLMPGKVDAMAGGAGAGADGGLRQSTLDRAVTMTSKWDALDAYDPWAEAEDECMVIDDQTLPQDDDLLHLHLWSPNHPNLSPPPLSPLSTEEKSRLLLISMPTSLSSDEEAGLLRIAMPFLDPAARPPNEEDPDLGPEAPPLPPISSPPLSASATSASSAPLHKQKRKRTLPSSGPSKSHNATEAKYRSNLNTKLDILRLCVPSLCSPPPAKSHKEKSHPQNSLPGGDDHDHQDKNPDNDSDNKGPGGGSRDAYGDGRTKRRCTKATIISQATEHILAQEHASTRLRADMARYRSRIAAFEALERGGGLWSAAMRSGL
jgi:hypothetical protein